MHVLHDQWRQKVSAGSMLPPSKGRLIGGAVPENAASASRSQSPTSATKSAIRDQSHHFAPQQSASYSITSSAVNSNSAVWSGGGDLRLTCDHVVDDSARAHCAGIDIKVA